MAVIDGGISDVHPDIAPNLDTECSYSTVPGHDFNEESSWDHASHVAGIIAGADNGIGTMGVAPSATLISLKALHGGSGTFGQVIMAIAIAADPESASSVLRGCPPADIINLSLGTVYPKRIAKGFHAGLTKVMNFAASKGVLVISAAGNDGIDFGQSKLVVMARRKPTTRGHIRTQ